MNVEYVYVYGEDHPVTKTDMFEGFLAGPLFHPMVEARIYAIDKKYKFDEGTAVCDAFDGLHLFCEDCKVSDNMVQKLKSIFAKRYNGSANELYRPPQPTLFGTQLNAGARGGGKRAGEDRSRVLSQDSGGKNSRVRKCYWIFVAVWLSV